MTPWFLGNSSSISHLWEGRMSGSFGDFGFLIPLALWSMAWSGVALWHAAKREEKGWFIFFLLVHTGGLLELLYLLFVVRITVQTKQARKKRVA
jgi:hypothetical protein